VTAEATTLDETEKMEVQEYKFHHDIMFGLLKTVEEIVRRQFEVHINRDYVVYLP